MDPQLHPLGTKVSSEGVRGSLWAHGCVKLAGVTDSCLRALQCEEDGDRKYGHVSVVVIFRLGTVSKGEARLAA